MNSEQFCNFFCQGEERRGPERETWGTPTTQYIAENTQSRFVPFAEADCAERGNRRRPRSRTVAARGSHSPKSNCSLFQNVSNGINHRCNLQPLKISQRRRRPPNVYYYSVRAGTKTPVKEVRTGPKRANGASRRKFVLEFGDREARGPRGRRATERFLKSGEFIYLFTLQRRFNVREALFFVRPKVDYYNGVFDGTHSAGINR